jgi:hypothetical protein
VDPGTLVSPESGRSPRAGMLASEAGLIAEDSAARDSRGAPRAWTH